MPLNIDRRRTARATVQVRSARQGHGHYLPDPEKFEREAAALKLYRSQLGWTDIGKELGVHRSTAKKWVEAAMRRWPGAQEDADYVRETEGARLRQVIAEAWKTYHDPGPAYGSSAKPVTVDGVVQLNRQVQGRMLNTIVTASKALAMLYGSNAPVRHSVQVNADIDVQIDALVRALTGQAPLPAAVAGPLALPSGPGWMAEPCQGENTP